MQVMEMLWVRWSPDVCSRGAPGAAAVRYGCVVGEVVLQVCSRCAPEEAALWAQQHRRSGGAPDVVLQMCSRSSHSPGHVPGLELLQMRSRCAPGALAL